MVVNEFMKRNIRTTVSQTGQSTNLERLLYQWSTAVGVLLHGSCDDAQLILNQASTLKLFDTMHIWLIFANIKGNDTKQFIVDKYHNLNLSVDADIVVASSRGNCFSLTDVYNFGKIQGNDLEMVPFGTWHPDSGLEIWLKGFKYYNRWNFHNLTLRAISVVVDQPNDFYPEMLSDIGYTLGVAAMTKIASQQLNLLKEFHNFRFNYTIAGRWIGSPENNSTLAVSNALYWEEQDIASTAARIFPHWLPWVDIFFPPITYLETRFYYLIPDEGVGDYENRFLTPMSPAVWWCTLVASFACMVVLGVAALWGSSKEPGSYAFFSVFAAVCQQDYEDGVQASEEAFTSQGRKMTLLILGLMSMLLYNYYTSSVVSWLLSASAPSIANLDGLINSDLELLFEDIGYTRGWLDNPGFFYYSGYENLKEDVLRDKKVTTGKRSLQPLQPVEYGLKLVRTGKYAYHTEPYTASQEISRTFEEKELCELGSLSMMRPAQVYIYGQKRSPYKAFFVWSLMRLSERGHLKASQARFAGTIPPCSGRMPRALALGQAAPAFVLLIEATLLAACILLWEILWCRLQAKKLSREQTKRGGKK